MAVKGSKKISHKTEPVMRLLTGGNLAVNPILDNEFKQSVIEMHSNDRANEETLAKKESEKDVISPNEIVLSEELLSEVLPTALKRFGCCTCDKCYAEAMAEGFMRVPYITIKIESDDDIKRAKAIKKLNLETVTKIAVKIALERRNLPKH